MAILSSHKKGTISILLVLVAAAGILEFSLSSDAAGLVCGDTSKEAPEQCDDGNLTNGDGCSSSCTTEVCGSGVVDQGEQCDDGNRTNGDGCSASCRVEFCGDSIIQTSFGEECDDGNGISGDGCSASCQPEAPVIRPLAREEEPVQVSAQPPVAPSSPVGLSPTAVQAMQTVNFLATEAAADYKQYLTSEEALQLETIIVKLANRRRLTQQEREWAALLHAKLEEAKLAERSRYTDLLKQFISTPISSEVVEEKDLERSRLVDVEVPVAIEELERAVGIIRRGELRAQVDMSMARLRRQGIDIDVDLPEDYAAYLTAGNRPILVFATLKTMKEAAEKYASNDVPTSLSILREEAARLKKALPVFQKEYGLKPEDIESLLSAIEFTAAEVTKQDTGRAVAAVNRFLGVLERRGAFSERHTAAEATMEMTELGLSTDELLNMVPEGARDTFENGAFTEQRKELLALLSSDERVDTLRTILREEGKASFDRRYEELRAEILRAGDPNTTDTLCDDTIMDALRCTNLYLEELQNAVRQRSYFSRIVGYLQDVFRIGS